jgi:hypothetical protein
MRLEIWGELAPETRAFLDGALAEACDLKYFPGLLTQGVPGVPQDPLAPLPGPLESSPDRESATGNAPALVPGPLAAL